MESLLEFERWFREGIEPSVIPMDLRKEYVVYYYLRKKGYKVESGLKYGTPFRVYDKSVPDEHAKWLVVPVASQDNIEVLQFISQCRVAHSVHKRILFACVDKKFLDVLFYEVVWKRMN